MTPAAMACQRTAVAACAGIIEAGQQAGIGHCFASWMNAGPAGDFVAKKLSLS
jgi:hypothetical protein